MAWCSVRKPGHSIREDLGDTRGVVTISRDCKGCHREEILLGPLAVAAQGTLGLTQFSNGQS